MALPADEMTPIQDSARSLKSDPAVKRGFLLYDRAAWLELATLGLILLVGAALRWHGLAWDEGYLFHPDERQIMLLVSNLSLPASPLDFFSASSPLNPHFFAYGSFPIYLLRALAPLAPPTAIVGPWQNDVIVRWVLLGRALSALFDLGTVGLTFMLGRRVYDRRVGLLAAACVAATVLHVQLSHFYAVDTLLTFFVMLTLYAAWRLAESEVESRTRWKIICGIALGLALATKVSAAPLVFPVGGACLRVAGATLAGQGISRRASSIWRAIRRPLLQILAIALLVFIVTQPYAVIDAVEFVRDVFRETFVARGWLDYPYTRQFAGTLPFVYQVWQGAVWAMGLPLGIFAWGGGALLVYHWWKTREWRDAFILSWLLVYFVVIGAQYAKYLRYLLPLLPVLHLAAARACVNLLAPRRFLRGVLVGIVLGASVLYSVAFVRMYDQEHPWLTASRWIYDNVRPGASLVVEQWDDALPTLIPFAQGARRGSEFKQETVALYEPDDDNKRAQLAQTLARADVIILASQRVYASIGRLPARYPMTTRYYQELFDGALGFEPVMTTRIDPNLFAVTIRDNPRAGLAFNASSADRLLDREDCCADSVVWSWGFADESFSVYDHPQPILFRKVRALTFAEIYSLLDPARK